MTTNPAIVAALVAASLLPRAASAADPVCFQLPVDWRVALEVRDGSAAGLVEALACLSGLKAGREPGTSDRAVSAVAAPAFLPVTTADAAMALRPACLRIRKTKDALLLAPARGSRCRRPSPVRPLSVRAVLDAGRKLATITTAPPAGPSRDVLLDPAAVVQVAEDRYAVARSVRDLALSDPMAFVQEGAAFPNVLGVPSPGFVIGWVRSGGVLDRMGLRAGDVVTAVNGLPLATLSDAFFAYGALARAEVFVVSVVRGLERRVMVYELR